MFVKCTVERDISFQECHHVLRGHKLYSCSRSFVFLNLRSSDWIVHSNLEDLQENVNLGTYDVMICYTKRPSILDNLNLYDYAKKFNHQTNKPKKRENIVRIYPLLSQKLLKSSDLDEEVCRQVVLLFVSWRNIDLEEDMSLSWAEIYVKYQLSVRLLPYFDVDEKVSSDLSDDSDEEVKKSKEDWMYVCEVKGNVPHQVELGYRTVDKNHSWNRSAEMVSECIVVCNTIQDAKKSKVLQQERTINHIELSADQKSVLSVVRQQILKINGRLNDEVSTPQIVLCEGLAGSGKTATLNAVVELIHEYCGKDSVLVLAPTGSSALQAQGVTVHSALRLGYNATGHVPDLKGEALYYWRKDHINVKFVLIEEYSMVGCR
ncbi:uncharacterized protein LOC127751386 [Frankliniella occidentalis]|uniref:Uncharacterized protein LOC127751386 n=1 Tax=Frankliniella occidentalis TaxID=133901 RepID=A0A9C6X862_FRAOC|nr:uncharacterized protein LOC127751386 [Frankliniella occidentalis]